MPVTIVNSCVFELPETTVATRSNYKRGSTGEAVALASVDVGYHCALPGKIKLSVDDPSRPDTVGIYRPTTGTDPEIIADGSVGGNAISTAIIDATGNQAEQVKLDLTVRISPTLGGGEYALTPYVIKITIQ